MVDARDVRHEHARGCLRSRRAASRRGDHHARAVSVALPRVTVYVARDCSLCGPALAVVRDAEGDLEFELSVVDITGDDQLERAYRERLPLIEIDGSVAFTYFVEPDALRAALRR